MQRGSTAAETMADEPRKNTDAAGKDQESLKGRLPSSAFSSSTKTIAKGSESCAAEFFPFIVLHDEDVKLGRKMKVVISRMLSIGAPISVEEDDVEFSFAMEYDDPPISYKLPRAAPIDIKWIPTAAVVAPASLSDRVSLPVVQPLLTSDPRRRKRPKT
ncbi:hypothetical protein NE237_017111 [Protea cynaroides]|uniref:Uncharacterized protein n=1 Tax=Protea cynaroides TaxID=273540 RepID=A0A9Q0QMH1_9MAGN|nr:hypothetical protein NE237_017111 [Protea cynaroides]